MQCEANNNRGETAVVLMFKERKIFIKAFRRKALVFID